MHRGRVQSSVINPGHLGCVNANGLHVIEHEVDLSQLRAD